MPKVEAEAVAAGAVSAGAVTAEAVTAVAARTLAEALFRAGLVAVRHADPAAVDLGAAEAKAVLVTGGRTGSAQLGTTAKARTRRSWQPVPGGSAGQPIAMISISSMFAIPRSQPTR